MRRADRLIKITHFLHSQRRAVTAQRIGDVFCICTRTVYRDIQSLMDSGVPISGEAGVSYMIDKQYYLPPVTFDMEELEALSLGISMVRQWTDDTFAEKADNAFAKIQAILPAALQGELQQVSTYSFPTKNAPPWSVSFSGLRECIRKRQKIQLLYRDEKHRETFRTIRPLALVFFSPVWLLAAWCESREDFRHFRLDRIQSINIDHEIFSDEKEKNLQAYLDKEAACHADSIVN